MGAHDSLLFRETGAGAPFGRFSVMSCPRIVGFAEGFVCRGGAYHTAPAGDKQNPVAAAFRTERRCDGNLAFWPCISGTGAARGRSKDDSGKAGEILRPENGGAPPPSAAERRQDETTSGQQVAPSPPTDPEAGKTVVLPS